MYRFMDAEEIEINQIDNLKMIHIYDLANAGGTLSNQVGESYNMPGLEGNIESKHITAMAVYYGDNKQKNLCTMDKHYNLLVQRVIYLYQRCDNRDSIMMNPDTKKIIEEACTGVEDNISPISKARKKYSSVEGEDIPKISSQAYVRMTAMPMIRYYLAEIYSMLDMNIEFKDDVEGWHGNVVLDVIVNGYEVKLPVKFIYESFTAYRVLVGNFLKEKTDIVFTVNYKQQSLNVNFDSRDAGIVGENTYNFDYGNGTAKNTIKVNDTVVFYQDTAIEEAEVKALGNVISPDILGLDMVKAKIYVLPWKAYHFCKLHVNENGYICRSDFDTGYVEYNNESILIRQYGWSHIANKTTMLSIKADGAMMERLIPDKKKGLVQTTFFPVGYYSNWDYKNKLENKYFYEELKEH